MSSKALLLSLLHYKAWADRELIAGFLSLLDGAPDDACGMALKVLEHAHIVDCIFVENLQGRTHGYTRTESDEVPDPGRLFAGIEQLDVWYIDFVSQLSDPQLVESIPFVFTDGKRGRMSREEMLAHIVSHAGYHRGEVGRVLTQITGSSPRDTFTGFLHEREPERATSN